MKKEQQAQEYAEKKLQEIPHRIDAFFNPFDIAQAYSDGYTAHEQSLWRSVEEELPKDDKNVLVRCPGDDPDVCCCIAWCRDGIWHFIDEFYYDCRVTHWMPIPPIPDYTTKTKKDGK